MAESKPLKIIAGAPDKPLRIGAIEIPGYVLEGEPDYRPVRHPLDVNLPRHWQADGNDLILRTRDAAGKDLNGKIMAGVARGMTDAQMKAVAEYAQGLR